MKAGTRDCAFHGHPLDLGGIDTVELEEGVEIAGSGLATECTTVMPTRSCGVCAGFSGQLISATGVFG